MFRSCEALGTRQFLTPNLCLTLLSFKISMAYTGSIPCLNQNMHIGMFKLRQHIISYIIRLNIVKNQNVRCSFTNVNGPLYIHILRGYILMITILINTTKFKIFSTGLQSKKWAPRFHKYLTGHIFVFLHSST